MTIRSGMLLFALCLGACARQEPGDSAPPATSTPAAGVEMDDAAWTRALLEHRKEVDEEFKTSKTSPMAGIQRLATTAPGPLYLTRQEQAFALVDSAEPGSVIALTREGTGWAWKPLQEGVSCEVAGEPCAPGSALEGPTLFSVGGQYVRFYPGQDEVIFTVFDPERPEKKAFEHLIYFPPDRSFAVPAQIVRFPNREGVEMLTNRSLKKTFYRYASLRFRLEGQDLELTAYKLSLQGPGSETLFVPFRDATSGQKSYGAGRFMDLDEPEGGELVLDFNRAYNPLCNYSPAYNCPIPPRENRLRVAVRAGEQTYPH